MSDYRPLLERTADVLSSRARNYRNLVVTFVVIGLASIGAAAALMSLRPVSGLLLLAPAYGLFLWRDGAILSRWRRQLGQAWRQRSIDLSAFGQVLNANPALPRLTVDGMLGTLPSLKGLQIEQSVSANTREAVLCALTARDACHGVVLACRAVGLAIAVLAALLALMLLHWAPLLALALLPALPVLRIWAGRREMAQATDKVRELARAAQFDADHYRDMLVSLSWQGCAPQDKERLLALARMNPLATT
jgi:hypothetical protein